MKISPLDIQQQQFKTRFRGFDIHEVDTFLDQMAEVFESLLAEIREEREARGDDSTTDVEDSVEDVNGEGN